MAHENSSSTLDIRDILSIVGRRKWYIILPVILAVGVAYGGSYLLEPEYESAAVVKIDNQLPLTTDLQRIIYQPGGDMSRSSYTERQNRLKSYYNEITSLRYMNLLDERLNLTEQPEIQTAANTYIRQQPELTPAQARLRVLQDKLVSNIKLDWAANDQIEVQYQSTKPKQAQSVANTLAEIFIGEKLKQDLTQIRSSQDFSDVQLEKYEKRVEDKIAEKTELEKEYMRMQLDPSVTSESNRAEITSEIDRTATEVEELREEESEILKQLSGVEGLNTAKLSLNPSDAKQTNKRELEDQISKIGDLMLKYTWNDPQILNFKVRQNNLLTNIERENRSLVAEQFSEYGQSTRQNLVRLFNIRDNLEYLYSKKPYLTAALEELRDKIDMIPDYEARLEQLDREIAAAVDIRDRFKRQQESSTISQALVQGMSNSKYRIIEQAKLPIQPVSPNRMKIIIMGLALGMLLGAGGVFLVEMLDHSIRKVDSLEEQYGLPVLGIAPKIDFMKKVAK